MGCSQRTGHCMCSIHMHLSHSSQTVSLPYALKSTQKINHPQLGEGTKKKHTKRKGTFYLSKTDICCHIRSTPGTIQWYNWSVAAHSEWWKTYTTTYQNTKMLKPLSIVSICLIFPQVSLSPGPQKIWKKKKKKL